MGKMIYRAYHTDEEYRHNPEYNNQYLNNLANAQVPGRERKVNTNLFSMDSTDYNKSLDQKNYAELIRKNSLMSQIRSQSLANEFEIIYEQEQEEDPDEAITIDAS